eukprot:gene1004-243_t
MMKRYCDIFSATLCMQPAAGSDVGQSDISTYGISTEHGIHLAPCPWYPLVIDQKASRKYHKYMRKWSKMDWKKPKSVITFLDDAEIPLLTKLDLGLNEVSCSFYDFLKYCSSDSIQILLKHDKFLGEYINSCRLPGICSWRCDTHGKGYSVDIGNSFGGQSLCDFGFPRYMGHEEHIAIDYNKVLKSEQAVGVTMLMWYLEGHQDPASHTPLVVEAILNDRRCNIFTETINGLTAFDFLASNNHFTHRDARGQNMCESMMFKHLQNKWLSLMLPAKTCLWPFLIGATLGKYHVMNSEQNVERRLPRLPPNARRIIGSYILPKNKYPVLKPQHYFPENVNDSEKTEYYQRIVTRLAVLKVSLDKEITDASWNLTHDGIYLHCQDLHGLNKKIL